MRRADKLAQERRTVFSDWIDPQSPTAAREGDGHATCGGCDDTNLGGGTLQSVGLDPGQAEGGASPQDDGGGGGTATPKCGDGDKVEPVDDAPACGGEDGRPWVWKNPGMSSPGERDIYLTVDQERANAGTDMHLVLTRVITRRPCTILDLGCGSGNSTFHEFAKACPGSRALGVDTPENVEYARSRYALRTFGLEYVAAVPSEDGNPFGNLPKAPPCVFGVRSPFEPSAPPGIAACQGHRPEQADAAPPGSCQDGREGASAVGELNEGKGWDVVTAYALLSWVPLSKHHQVLSAIRDALAPGGVAVVRTMAQGDRPYRRAVEVVSQREPWREYFASAGKPPYSDQTTEGFALCAAQAGFDASRVTISYSKDVFVFPDRSAMTLYFRQWLPALKHIRSSEGSQGLDDGDRDGERPREGSRGGEDRATRELRDSFVAEVIETLCERCGYGQRNIPLAFPAVTAVLLK